MAKTSGWPGPALSFICADLLEGCIEIGAPVWRVWSDWFTGFTDCRLLLSGREF